jgi:CDGSH-type Zn-finger protein
MSAAIPAQKSPYAATVEAGKQYWWCACGRSRTQPFCDGSHKAVGMAPVMYQADKSGEVWFCGCKATSSQPLCDGSHNKL